MQRLLVATLAVVLSASAWAQDEKPARIEAVFSVKLAAPDARGMYIRTSPGGTVNITNMPLKEIVALAYRVQSYEITGATGWMESQRYDVIAKPEHPLKDGEYPIMFRTLLADRFGVVLHRELGDMPMYALIVMKPGKLGPGLAESKEGGCTVPDRTKPAPRPEPGKAPERYCGNFMMQRTGMTGVGISLENFVNGLSWNLGRRVVDKTGLTGKFDLDLKYSPEDPPTVPASSDAPRPVAVDSSDPPLLTAIQEQLGLKLQAQKSPVEIVVIDKATQPEAN
jgi:uncharacterized protein (TIGR03435 family)